MIEISNSCPVRLSQGGKGETRGEIEREQEREREKGRENKRERDVFHFCSNKGLLLFHGIFKYAIYTNRVGLHDTCTCKKSMLNHMFAFAKANLESKVLLLSRSSWSNGLLMTYSPDVTCSQIKGLSIQITRWSIQIMIISLGCKAVQTHWP